MHVCKQGFIKINRMEMECINDFYGNRMEGKEKRRMFEREKAWEWGPVAYDVIPGTWEARTGGSPEVFGVSMDSKANSVSDLK